MEEKEEEEKKVEEKEEEAKKVEEKEEEEKKLEEKEEEVKKMEEKEEEVKKVEEKEQEKEEEEEKEEDVFKYNEDGISIYTYDLEDLDEYKKKYKNLTFIEIPEEEKKRILESIGLDKNEKLFIEIIDKPNNDSKAATSDYEYKFFIKNKTELNLSNIKDDINIKIYVPIRNLTKANFDYALLFSKDGYDIYDKFSDFYIDPCTAAYIHRNDIPLKDRKKDIYPNVTMCEGGNCHYKSVSLEDHRIACECNLNADKLNETEDDYMEDDDNVGNYILDKINYEIIRCYYLHFNFNNLKTNPAFYSILLIFILVIIFFIKFFCFGMQRLRGLLLSRNIEELKLFGFYHQCHHSNKNKSNPKKKGAIIKKKSKFAKKENNENNNKKIKDTDGGRMGFVKVNSSFQKQSRNYLIFPTDSSVKKKLKKKKLMPNIYF